MGTSVAAGGDSVLSAVGVCAPAPGLFITDGASYIGARESLLSATEPLPCAGPAPPAGPLFWHASYFGITKDGANRVSLALDRTVHHFDVAAIGGFGEPSAIINRPIWTPNQQNGLPGMDWGIWDGTPTGVRWLQYVGAPLTQDPIASNAARMFLCVARAANAVGGTLCTFRLTATDRQNAVFTNLSNHIQVIGRADDGGGGFFVDLGTDIGHPAVPVDYTGVTAIFGWIDDGAGHLSFYANGVQKPVFYFPNPPLPSDAGASGFSIGYENSRAYTGPAWSGLIFEDICYAGNNLAVFTAALNYLNAIWKVY